MRLSLIILFLSSAVFVKAQPFGQYLTNSLAEDVLLNNYDPQAYDNSNGGNDPLTICCAMQDELSPDSLFNILETLESFHSRHTYSDTLSNDTGIGAARRWFYQRLEKVSSDNNGRLIPTYLHFEMPSSASCGAGAFKNVLGVLPGTDTSDHSVIIVEAHMDSRCDDRCDADCFSPGVDDNGSGTALVLELARVLSQFDYPHTIVFMATVGEEQGLFGAEAMSDYCLANNIPVKAVFNNDVVGGIVCGQTASPPSACGVPGTIDSTQIRIFSFGLNFSPHQSLARFIKMNYEGKTKAIAETPMVIDVMNQEDRTGRGGDHIPFRIDGYPAIRFTSAHEHGNANTSSPFYRDHQHTGRDVLGYDTDGDLEIDSMFVNTRYLKRNAMINGTAITAVAMTGSAPEYTITQDINGNRVDISSNHSNKEYRIGIRTDDNDFDQVYTFSGSDQFYLPPLDSGVYYISIANVNSSNNMSLFGDEQLINTITFSTPQADTVVYYPAVCNSVGIFEPSNMNVTKLPVELLKGRPNPFTGITTIEVINHGKESFNNAQVVVYDINSRKMKAYPLLLDANDKVSVDINLTDFSAGLYFFQLLVNDLPIDTKRMIMR